MKKYLAAFVMSVASAVAFSMTVTTWKGTGGSWNDAANWDNGVPVQGGKAVFNQDATIEDDFALPGNLVVSVAEGKTLNLNGVISGEGTLVFGTKYNAADCGTVNLNGENTFAGNVAVSNGFVYVNTDTACGTDDGEVFIYARNRNTKLYFTDVNFRKRIFMHNGKDADIGYSSFVVFNGENTIDVMKIPNTARFAVKTGTTRLKGGLQRTGNPIFIPSVAQGAKFIIEDVPVTALFYQNASKGEIVFACEGNKIDLGSGTGYHFSMPVKCGVNNCFTEDSVMCVGEQSYALLNLNGTTQTIAQLRSKISSTTYHAGSITSHVGGTSQGRRQFRQCRFERRKGNGVVRVRSSRRQDRHNHEQAHVFRGSCRLFGNDDSRGKLVLGGKHCHQERRNAQAFFRRFVVGRYRRPPRRRRVVRFPG